MRRNFEIRSFNFITWNWSKDVIIEDVKREISSAAESPVGGQNWKLHEMYDD